MQRSEFHDEFDTPGPVILPVIHVVDEAQTATNIDHITESGLKGCFLINHDFGIDSFLSSRRFVAVIRISGSG